MNRLKEYESEFVILSTNPAERKQIKLAAAAKGVRFDEGRMYIDLVDGRSLAVPLEWFPRLYKATPEQRNNWELGAGGYTFRWDEIDEDIAVPTLLGFAF